MRKSEEFAKAFGRDVDDGADVRIRRRLPVQSPAAGSLQAHEEGIKAIQTIRCMSLKELYCMLKSFSCVLNRKNQSIFSSSCPVCATGRPQAAHVKKA